LFTVLLLLSAVASFVGSLTGLGGGVVLVPVYTLVLGVPIEYATGASLVSTIATSLGTSVAYVRDRITNVRIGMSLEVATSLGALTGSLAVALIYSLGLQRLVYVVFGAVLLLSSYTQMKVLTTARRARPPPDLCTKRLRLYGRY
jgi:uncharacterized membrane protein YfcA